MRSVVPAQKAIGQYLNFDLVPWGNAQIFKNEYVFGIICQHGEAECWGNAFHACVIDKYDYEKAFEFVACFFRTYENIKDVKGKCESVKILLFMVNFFKIMIIFFNFVLIISVPKR